MDMVYTSILYGCVHPYGMRPVGRADARSKKRFSTPRARDSAPSRAARASALERAKRTLMATKFAFKTEHAFGASRTTGRDGTDATATDGRETGTVPRSTRARARASDARDVGEAVEKYFVQRSRASAAVARGRGAWTGEMSLVSTVATEVGDLDYSLGRL